METKCEITLEQLQNDYDWGEVFGEGNGGNCDGTTTAGKCEAGILETVSLDPVHRADVAEIVAAVNGENDGPKWIGLFRLKDGRWLIAEGSCDYTGWDCRAGNSLTLFTTRENAVQYGLTDDDRARLTT